MGELYPRFITFREKFEGNNRTAGVALIAPAVTQFSAVNHFCNLAKVEVSLFFRPSRELEFESFLRPEFLQVKIPFFHFFFSCNSLPDYTGRGIIGALDNKWCIVHIDSIMKLDNMKPIGYEYREVFQTANK